MLGTVIETIKKYSMLEAGDEVVAALSGGADSVCLLLVLNELSSILNIKVSAIHVNHCLRGEESDRDEQFCADLCRKHGIPLITGRFDVNGEASRRKISTEQAARDIRYRFFAENSSGRKTATAHNANDNTETVIFNLIRGTGTRGIAGIPPVRDNIIRPLLGVTREQIEAFLNERNQEYVTDSTNLTDEYTRNRIRHSIIPVLREINPGLFGTITSDSDNFRTDNSFIEEETEKAYRRCLTGDAELSGIRHLHSAVCRRCISRLLSENNIEVSSRRISEIMTIVHDSGKINLSGDIYIISENEKLFIKTISSAGSEQICFPLQYGTNIFRNKKIEISVKENKNDCSGTIIDAEKISGTPVIRNRRPGDRIRFKGNTFTSSVKKVFNSRFELSERDSICFIADDEGPVFIENTGIADRVAVTDTTKKIMEIKIHCE